MSIVVSQYNLLLDLIRENIKIIEAMRAELRGASLRPGDKVKILPSGFSTHIKAIELNGVEIKEAFSPMSVIVRLTDEIDISRGDMIVRENNSPEVTQDLDVLITWMSEKPVCKRTKVFVKHTTNECISLIKEIKYKIDINTLHRIENIEQIEMNDIARVSIRTSKPLFVDSYNRNRTYG